MTESPLAAAQRLIAQAVGVLRGVAESGTAEERVSVLALCESTVRQRDQVTVATVAGLDRDGVFTERGYRSAAQALGDWTWWCGWPRDATMAGVVLEIADFAVLPGQEDDFVAAVREGLTYIADSPGFRSARVTRGLESPSRFVLLIEWDSLEAHTVGFRESENFTRWRGLVGPFFDGAPRVEHFDEVAAR